MLDKLAQTDDVYSALETECFPDAFFTRKGRLRLRRDITDFIEHAYGDADLYMTLHIQDISGTTFMRRADLYNIIDGMGGNYVVIVSDISGRLPSAAIYHRKGFPWGRTDVVVSATAWQSATEMAHDTLDIVRYQDYEKI